MYKSARRSIIEFISQEKNNMVTHRGEFVRRIIPPNKFIEMDFLDFTNLEKTHPRKKRVLFWIDMICAIGYSIRFGPGATRWHGASAQYSSNLPVKSKL